MWGGRLQEPRERKLRRRKDEDFRSLKSGGEVSASHLGCQRGPGGERWSGWSARSHGYRPPRDTRPRRSTCEADGARSPSARVWSGGSARCTSTGPLQRHTCRHTTLSQTQSSLSYAEFCGCYIFFVARNCGYIKCRDSSI